MLCNCQGQILRMFGLAAAVDSRVIGSLARLAAGHRLDRLAAKAATKALLVTSYSARRDTPSVQYH